jgi:di/tricarboxylate transporter
VGIIANTRMAEAGLPGHEGRVFLANFLAHVAVSLAAYVFWLRRAKPMADTQQGQIPAASAALGRTHLLSLLVIGAWIVAAVAFRVPVGPSAFVAAVLLLALAGADDAATLRQVPWGAIVMVCGVSTLVGLVEKAGGLELLSGLIAALSTPATINGVIAFVTGLVSTWSSTSGVVLPSFLPTVPGLVARLPGADPLAVSLSINVGSALVDVSPLSTLGALCVAAVAEPEAARRLFRALMAWGLSMTVVGALLCQLGAGALAAF